MTQAPDVSIIIVSWNTRDLLRACLASIESAAGPVTREVIVVDNASRDQSADMVALEFPTVRLIRNEDNFGFAAANNQGMEVARGRYVLLLNSDTLVLDGAVAKAVAFADQRPSAGIVGCRTIFPDGRMQRNCFLFPSTLNIFLTVTKLSQWFKSHRFFGRYRFGWWDYQSAREVDGLAGCFMLARRSAVDRVGPMAEHYFMYAEDADWCWRFRKACYSVWYTPEPCIIHLHDASASQDATAMRVQYRKSILAFIEQRSGLAARWVCNAIFLTATVVGLLAVVCRLGRGASSAGERTACRRKAYECFRLHVRELFPWRPADGSDPKLIERCIAFCKRSVALMVSTLFHCARSVTRRLAKTGRQSSQILYYHGVTASQQERFRRQVHWLRKRRRLVALSTVLRDGENTTAITFDDGFENVRQFAVPVLRELGVPATVFAVSGQLGRTPQWQLPPEHRDAKERLMSAEALTALCGDDIQVESHSCTHPHLSGLAPDALAEELAHSRGALQKLCEAPVRYLSVPYGDWNPEVLQSARSVGYERVFTSEPTFVVPSSRAFAVGRIAVSPDDWMWEFKLKALGAYHWKHWLRPRKPMVDCDDSETGSQDELPSRVGKSNSRRAVSSDRDLLPAMRE